MDADEISLENLQAQIDMSMSFAQRLVSSWVKPSKSGVSRKKLDLENELLEAARRRPRLGVGAAVPDAVPAPRDTARLKGQLVGKKRVRDQEESGAAAKRIDDEDEEESRAGAIKKKVKLDPFDKPSKKQSGPSVPPAPVQAAPSTSKGMEVRHELEADTAASKSAPVPPEQPTQSSKRRKKNKRLEPPAPAASAPNSSSNEDDAVVSSGPMSSTPKRISKEKCQGVVDKFDVLSTSSGSQREPSQPSDTGIKFAAAALIRPREPPSPSKLSADLLKKPLLNLQEISDGSDSEDEADKSTPSSPKKKRRRRKKKKKATVDSPTSSAPALSSTIKLLIS